MPHKVGFCRKTIPCYAYKVDMIIPPLLSTKIEKSISMNDECHIHGY